MSTGQARVFEDEEEYCALCRKFGEEPEHIDGYWGKMLDCYGTHAKDLRARAAAERSKP